ncbi:MAG: MarR family transcriptional regulator [Acidimicrobiaceae bacterium]|nr:MarR family transcriptional regulator [Acidimicrobiaceae bacterium]
MNVPPEDAEFPGDRDDVDEIEAAWRRERPDLDASSIGVLTRIRRIARLLDRHRTRLLTELGTDSSTLDLLATLRRAGPPYRLTPTELADRTLITTGAMSQRLMKAESSGWIRREAATGDARSIVVSLTTDGFELVERVVGEVLRSEQQLLDRFTPTEQAELAAMLRRFLADVRTHG